MKLSLSMESVQVLREFAELMPKVIEHLTESTSALYNTYNSLIDTIGPHAGDFLDMLHNVNNSQISMNESIKELSFMLNGTADKMESYIQHGSSTGSNLLAEKNDITQKYFTEVNDRLKNNETILEPLSMMVREVGIVAPEVVKKSVESVKNISETVIKKTAQNQVKSIKYVGDAVLSKIDDIKNLTPEQLREKVNFSQKETANSIETNENKVTKERLADEQKAKIKEVTSWSDKIMYAISSMEEYEIYKNAGLIEVEIGEKKCLIRNDINWEQKDAMGRTNKERAEQGLSPFNKDGKIIELHHIGQHAYSPLAELTLKEHRGKGNDTILHDKTKESEIDRQAFAGQRSAHWEARVYEGGDQ